jgi:hypothetical protein
MVEDLIKLVYCIIDKRCSINVFRPFDDSIKGFDLVTGCDNAAGTQMNNGDIARALGHPFILDVVKEAQRNANVSNPVQATGPAVWSHVLNVKQKAEPEC